ncbi:2-dehydropantoate 2-reductase [Eremomyces bilateralis CBS 781.70]|uniref:2-dehydropantoate 2-reductase n=1 Tax=Eremomyces bilateralis CBS 781.70 TaxID=1392243 RepID=A0A6G1FW69_9PEZI|nr:2-dehydropantoate 2-reductase [Eremomyces bilateralis CBS 781.70]KAF1809869.1 2-dehydropantoate 2-reductase [Eremomyces bilateralis CBS 781.70]
MSRSFASRNEPDTSPEEEHIEEHARIAQQYGEEEVTNKRIHILGIGSIGKLVAHTLRGLPSPPPISLLLHRRGLIESWKAQGEAINVTTRGTTESRRGFDIELAVPPVVSHGQVVAHQDEESDSEWIDNLVLTVKANSTFSALMSVKHRLRRESTILFLQNGMGIVEEVKERVFPDPESRPHFVLGITSHGVRAEGDWTVTHAGYGTTVLGLVKRDDGDRSYPPTAKYLIRTFLRAPVLAAVASSPTELLQIQLEKLVVNSVINPMTALLDCRNGALKHNFDVTRAMRLLIAEACVVIRALPELQGIPDIASRFSAERLETMVVAVADRTKENMSSMLVDVRAGRNPETPYINGYLVKRGEELGIQCVIQYFVKALVEAKQNMILQEINQGIPLVG